MTVLVLVDVLIWVFVGYRLLELAWQRRVLRRAALLLFTSAPMSTGVPTSLDTARAGSLFVGGPSDG